MSSVSAVVDNNAAAVSLAVAAAALSNQIDFAVGARARGGYGLGSGAGAGSGVVLCVGTLRHNDRGSLHDRGSGMNISPCGSHQVSRRRVSNFSQGSPVNPGFGLLPALGESGMSMSSSSQVQNMRPPHNTPHGSRFSMSGSSRNNNNIAYCPSPMNDGLQLDPLHHRAGSVQSLASRNSLLRPRHSKAPLNSPAASVSGDSYSIRSLLSRISDITFLSRGSRVSRGTFQLPSYATPNRLNSAASTPGAGVDGIDTVAGVPAHFHNAVQAQLNNHLADADADADADYS